MPKNSYRRTWSSSTEEIHLRSVFIHQISHCRAYNWSERGHFINHNQILESTRCKEEGVTFFQRNCRAELRFIIVVSKVGNLVEITVKRKRLLVTYCFSGRKFQELMFLISNQGCNQRNSTETRLESSCNGYVLRDE